MRSARFPRLAIACLVLALPLFAKGQEPADATPLEVPPPPTDIRPFDDSIEEPEVTIRRDERGVVEEYRVGGQLYMLKIIPDVGEPYFLIDRGGKGHFEAHNPGRDISVPMWLIGTF
ncbi:MAG: DUF2782 domain-containing protein [Betaproteobacteria bacterium]|nr:DUF2782 domain-containing protein [Betaproteobacteria bacterium]